MRAGRPRSQDADRTPALPRPYTRERDACAPRTRTGRPRSQDRIHASGTPALPGRGQDARAPRTVYTRAGRPRSQDRIHADGTPALPGPYTRRQDARALSRGVNTCAPALSEYPVNRQRNSGECSRFDEFAALECLFQCVPVGCRLSVLFNCSCFNIDQPHFTNT